MKRISWFAFEYFLKGVENMICFENILIERSIDEESDHQSNIKESATNNISEYKYYH